MLELRYEKTLDKFSLFLQCKETQKAEKNVALAVQIKIIIHQPTEYFLQKSVHIN